MRVLFMGTPDFALPTLKALCEKGYEIVGAVTQPDKPKGRGHHMMPPPIKEFALEKNIPVYQPSTLRGEEFAALLAELDPDLIVVAAFGKILPQNVLDYPKHGCICVHGSLLPKYRGAAPMQRAIIDVEPVTGITTMYMDAGIDTGDMILKSEVAITPEDNFETIHDKMAACGAETLLRTLKALREGTITREKQDDSQSNYAPKIEKADCLIDFTKDATAVHNQIRGLSPIPLSFTHTPDGKLLKVVKAEISKREGVCGKAGEVTDLSRGICVACGVGEVRLLGVLPEGKGRMSADDFIRGRKINAGDILK